VSDALFSPGENGNVEYYEEFPIRLVHQFEGICLATLLSSQAMHALEVML